MLREMLTGASNRGPTLQPREDVGKFLAGRRALAQGLSNRPLLCLLATRPSGCILHPPPFHRQVQLACRPLPAPSPKCSEAGPATAFPSADLGMGRTNKGPRSKQRSLLATEEGAAITVSHSPCLSCGILSPTHPPPIQETVRRKGNLFPCLPGASLQNVRAARVERETLAGETAFCMHLALLAKPGEGRAAQLPSQSLLQHLLPAGLWGRLWDGSPEPGDGRLGEASVLWQQLRQAGETSLGISFCRDGGTD